MNQMFTGQSVSGMFSLAGALRADGQQGAPAVQRCRRLGWPNRPAHNLTFLADTKGRKIKVCLRSKVSEHCGWGRWGWGLGEGGTLEGRGA